jgi:polar amino acid transport system substrate-binding protein
VGHKIGVPATLKQIAVGARIPELQEGRVDILAASLTHTREREVVIDFSLTIFVTGQRVMVRRDSGITTLAQLSGKQVVTVKGGTQEANLRKNEPALKATVNSALRELEDCGEAQKLFL